ncbi:hypothetical protein C8F01DRAFT_497987 [Mycena amicta]|nr:hypothetical protein C8F01DRAFT_497987 [Mycena amicta]
MTAKLNGSIPLKLPRLISLSLAWAWALISLAAEINAFVKQNKDRTRVRSEVPEPTQVTINTNDLFAAGAVVTAVCGIIMALCFAFIALIAIDANTRSGISTRTLPIQFISLGFLSTWLFATQIAVSDFVARRSVKVSATIDGFKVPNGIVKTIEQAFGEKTAYKDFEYLRLLAVLPWFAFIFTVISAIISFLAVSRRRIGSRPAKPAPGPNTSKELPPDPSNAPV